MSFLSGTTEYGMKGGDDQLAARTQEFAKLQLIARQKALLPEDQEAPDPTGFKSFFMRTVDIISRPNYASAGFWDTLAGNGRPGENAMERVFRELFSGLGGLRGDKETFGDVLEQAGFGPGMTLMDIVGENGLTRNFNPSTRGAVGLALDIFLDPLTYVSAPVKNAAAAIGQGGKIKYLNQKGMDLLGQMYDQKIEKLRKSLKMGAEAGEVEILNAARKDMAFLKEIDDSARFLVQSDGMFGTAEARRQIQQMMGEKILKKRGAGEFFEKEGLRWRPLPGVDLPVGVDRLLGETIQRTGHLFRETATKWTVGDAMFRYGDRLYDDITRLFTRHPRLTRFNKAYTRLETARFQRVQAAQHIAGLEMDKLLKGFTKTHLKDTELMEGFIRAVEVGPDGGKALDEFLAMAATKGVEGADVAVQGWRNMFDSAGGLEVAQGLIKEEHFGARLGRYFPRLTRKMDKNARAKLKEFSAGNKGDLREFSEASRFDTWDEFKEYALSHGAKAEDFVTNIREAGVVRLAAHYEGLINQQFVLEVGSRFGMAQSAQFQALQRNLAKKGIELTETEAQVISELQSRDPMFTGDWEAAARIERRRVLNEARLNDPIEGFKQRLDEILDSTLTEENAARAAELREAIWENHTKYARARRMTRLADSGIAKQTLTETSAKIDGLMVKFEANRKNIGEMSDGELITLQNDLEDLLDAYGEWSRWLGDAGGEAFKVRGQLPLAEVRKTLALIDDIIQGSDATAIRAARAAERERFLEKLLQAQSRRAQVDNMIAATKQNDPARKSLYAARDRIRDEIAEIDSVLSRPNLLGAEAADIRTLREEFEQVQRQIKGLSAAVGNMKKNTYQYRAQSAKLDSMRRWRATIEKKIATAKVAHGERAKTQFDFAAHTETIRREIATVAEKHNELLKWRQRVTREARVEQGRFEQQLEMLDNINNAAAYNKAKTKRLRDMRGDLDEKQVAIDMEMWNKLRPEAKRAYLLSSFQQIDSIKDFERFLNAHGDDLRGISGGLARAVDGFYEGKTFVLRDMYGQPYRTISVGDARNYVTVPEGIAQSLKNLEDSFETNPEIMRLLETFDQLNNWFKVGVTRYFPSFHVRNAYSNVAAVYTDIGIEALDPRRAKQAIDILIGRDGTFTLANGKKITYAQIRGELDTLGVRADKLFLYELTGKYAGDPIEAVLAKALQHDDARGKAWGLIEKAYSVPNNVENHARAMHYLALRRRGYTPEDASFQVNKFLFDYADLSAAEKGVFRRLFPFWVWNRKNAERQIRNLYERPGRLSTQIKLFAGDRGPDGDLLPEYLRGQMQVKLQEDETGETWMTGIDLPISSMDLLWAGSIGKTFREFGGLLTPLIKNPIEIGVGTELFSGQGTRGHGRINTRLGNALNRNLPQVLKDYFELENRGTPEKPQWDANRLKVHLVFKGIFLSRFVSYGSQIDETLQQIGNGDEVAGAKAVFKLFAGMDLRTYDLSEKQRATLYNRLNRVQELLMEEGVMGEFKKPFLIKEEQQQQPAAPQRRFFGG